MFRPPSGHLQVFILCILKEPAACYFLSFRCCTLYCFCYDVPCFPCAGVRVHTHTSTGETRITLWRMVSSVMSRRVALVRTDVSEEPSTPIIRVTRICELGTTLAATNNRRTLRRGSFETSVLTRTTRRIPEDIILHSHRRENLKSYNFKPRLKLG
jgi:hypothetical protein